MGHGAASWDDVVDHRDMKVKAKDRAAILAGLSSFGSISTSPVAQSLPKMTVGQYKTLLKLCPCLFNQVAMQSTSRAVVHFCELTLGTQIVSTNVNEAFKVQHPNLPPPFAYPMLDRGGNGGTIMELLCSDVLTNEGVPEMELDADRWPVWTMPGHALLNEGNMSELQAFGDILIPCGPTNLVISVKSEVARERLLYSSNSIEGIGFGFFKEPEEFWTSSRMNLYKRMGFSAIYMPDETHTAVMDHVTHNGSAAQAVNINGTPLYRPHSVFGADMRRVVGRSSLKL